MKTQKWKRLLSWIMTVVMVINMIPVQAFATETEDHTDHIHVEDVVVSEGTTDEESVEPSLEPTVEPSAEPTVDSSTESTVESSEEVSEEPDAEPTVEPTEEPSAEPTVEPTVEPTIESTAEPTAAPSSIAVMQIDDEESAAAEANFKVGSNTYETLVDAIKAAGERGIIVLLTDYTLPAGDYTIPSGVTLLIPYDSANTLCTTEPTCVDSYTTPTAYRTLTMASGANLVINGSLSLSAQQSAQGSHNGAPTGPVSFVKMKPDSIITVKNGGFLYAWGYITGSGSVVAESGATVYEDFQLMDWRGGNATSEMVVDATTYHTFPMSQYYVQNIEVPLTLHAGAIEKAYMSAAITLVGIQGSDLPFIGTSNSMFTMSSGYIVKDYIEGTGRLKIEVHGDVSVTPISMSMQLTQLGGIQTLNTADMILMINGNMTVDVLKGTIIIAQDIGLMPGTEFYIRQGVTCYLSSNKKIIAYDSEDWSGYVGSTNRRYIPLIYAPGGTGEEGRDKDALIQIDGTVDVSGGSIYTTPGGANVYSTGTGVITAYAGSATIYQAVQKENYIKMGDYNGWTEIAVNPAWLKNADGSFTKIAEENTTSPAGGKFQYKDGRWHVYGCKYEGITKAEASCTTPGVMTYTCNKCTGTNKHSYEAEIAALGHTGNKIAGVAATCTETGLTEGEYCTSCDYKVEQTAIEALGHQKAIESKTNPTCTTEGKVTYYCSRIGCDYKDFEDDVLPATGHKPGEAVIEKVVAATCTIGGSYEEVYYCTECIDLSTAKHTEISRKKVTSDPLGHTEVIDEAVEPTCTETGLTEGKHCSVCKEVLEEQTEVAAKGHTEVIDQAVESDCETTGLTEGKHCSVCNTTIKAQSIISALNHNWDYSKVVEKITKEPTCTEEGTLEIGIECLRCGDIAVGGDVIPLPAKGHTKGEAVVEKEVAPTCTEDGSYDTVVYCTVETCKAEVSRVTTTVEATGHTKGTAVVEKEIAPTCTEDGSYDTVVYCTVETCKAEVSRVTTTIEATGHTKGEAVVEKEVAPTCTEDGSYDTVVYCTVETCKAEISRETTTVDAAGHTEVDPVKENAVESSCEEDGKYENVIYCSVCDTELSRVEVTDPADGHVAGEVEKENVVEATGSKDGSYEAVVYCKVCGDELSRKTVTIPATGEHTPLPAVKEVTKEATCTEAGNYEMVVYCEECSEEISRDPFTESAKGHTKGESVIENYVAAKCEKEGGYDNVVYCTVCKDSNGNATVVSSEHIKLSALEHVEGEVVVENEVNATCTEAGSYDEVVYCSVCRNELSRETITTSSLGGHIEGKAVRENQVTPTCKVEGSYDLVVYCSVCRDEVSRQVGIVDPKADHTHASAVNENVTQATCGTDGSYDSVVYCAVCDTEISRETIAVPATGEHVSSDAVSENVVPSTCTAKGSMDYVIYCKTCTDEKGNPTELKRTTIEIPLAAHSYISVSGKDATCTETGLTDGVKCKVCGNWETEQTEIPVKEHTEKAVPGKAETCTENGLTDGVQCSVCQEWIKAQEVIDNIDGHSEETVPSREETCEIDGLTEGKKCTVCQEWTVEQIVIDEIKGHNVVILEAEEATCTTTGLTEGIYCDICDTTLVPQSETGLALHTYNRVEGTEATCTEAGITFGMQCIVCQTWAEGYEQSVIPALGHTEEKIEAVDPTCEGVGYTEGTQCSVCEEILVKPEEIEALGHEMGTPRIEPEATCTEDGLAIYTCAICKKSEEEVIPALGHELVTIPAQKPTFTEDGWEEYEICVRDPETCFYTTKTQDKVIPAYGVAVINDFDDFIENLAILEDLANTYLKSNYSKLSAEELVIKYIRTGVERYDSMSWQAFAGIEDEKFAQYVTDYENTYNEGIENYEDMMKVTGLKNLTEFNLPNGDKADIGHVFGTLDISITNKTSTNHADVSGWAGDTVDLLTAADNCHIDATGKTVEQLVDEIRDKIFLKEKDYLLETYNPTLNVDGELEGTFSQTDIDGDLDGFYIFNELMNCDYKNGTLTELFSEYMTSALTNEKRAEYFLKNRFDGVSLRSDVRDAVYNEYVGNSVASTLERTRVFENTDSDINNMRKAACYVVADYLCKLAGDFVEGSGERQFSVFSTETAILAPGITQKLIKAQTSAGSGQMDYYVTISDVTRDDVSVFTNYGKNDPYISQGKSYSEVEWELTRVLDQANYAQERHSDPTTDNYVPNYNVVAAINGTGFNMYTGEPSDLLMMEGVEVHNGSFNHFFGILKDGTPVIGSQAEYEQYKANDQIVEAISSFGMKLVENGQISTTESSDRAPRTAIGITKTGKVIFVVVDGRQGQYSCGARYIDVAQIMVDAGAWVAINLDGGGSSTYVAKQPGSDELTLMNSSSDGTARFVASSLFAVSTAPSSTEFDHAVIESDYTYLTIGSTAQLSAKAVSATGNAVEMPEGVTWAVSNTNIGTITEDGVFTAKAKGKVEVTLMLNGEPAGTKTLYVVTPNNIYFTRDNVNAIYGRAVTLPIKAVYDGKDVSFNENDITITVSNATAGVIDGFSFTGNEASGLRKVTAKAELVTDPTFTSTTTIAMFKEEEASFDFDNATGGDSQLAFNRDISNATHIGNGVYMIQDMDKDMVTSYTFAIDMSQIQIPAQLRDLTYMLPGSDRADASAWKFLLKLAERISNLTYVEAKLAFDTNMDVDYNDISVSNEYFIFDREKLVFDKDTNTLTIKLQWIDQDKPIDEDTANPLCILTGIKLTPKADAKWSQDNKLKVVTTGTISYDIYLGTSTLYSYACKPEGQAIGLLPYENDADVLHPRGGHFMDTYKEFKDSYTLINLIPEGWVMEDGGWAYYHDGERYTGICFVEEEGLYYDFGENGVNVGQSPYSGEYADAKDNEYYIISGEVYKKGQSNFKDGWLRFGENEWRYYNPTTGIRETVIVVTGDSSCIIDTKYTFTSESGAVKVIQQRDTGGHEYAKQPDGNFVCTVCGFTRIELSETTIALSNYVFTYTGSEIKPTSTVVASDGYVLVKRNQSDYPDYYTTYENNIEVGVGKTMINAKRYGYYVNLMDWRGNAAGEIPVYFEIRPDLPTNLEVVTSDGETKLQWTTAKASDVTYVIYKSTNGENYTEYGSTKDTSYVIKSADKSAYFKIGTTKVGLDENGKEKVYESINKTNAVTGGSLNVIKPDIVFLGYTEEGKPKMSWSAADGDVKNYIVYRSTDAKFKTYTTSPTKYTTYTHTKAEVDTTYYYRVRVVYNDGGESLFSNTITATPVVGTPSAKVTDDRVPVIKWGTVESAAKYIVYRANSIDGTYEAIKTTTSTTFKDTTTSPGQSYYYKVVAVSSKGIKGEESGIVSVHKDPLVDADIVRVAGENRYETSFDIADVTKERMGVDKFKNVVVASGKKFADALAGSYLAKVKEAPILMASGSAKNNERLKEYITANLAPGGTVYILGGEAVIPTTLEATLSGFNVKRISGKNRYITNIEILKEAGVTNQEVIVATGLNFADSLAASAVGKPILLVNNNRGELSAEQKAYLSTLSTTKYYIVGGTSAVNEKLAAEISKYGKVERIQGNTRYQTSVAIANRFFTNPQAAILTFAQKFPDGLCGGVLAMSMNAPLILTKTDRGSAAEVYVGTNSITEGVILGGSGLIDDDTAMDIFNTDSVS